MPISNTPDLAEPVFAEPWEAQAFALTVALHRRGLFGWDEWARALADRVKAAEGEAYYASWLNALETLLTAKGLADAGALAALKADWEQAYLTTPHGQPVALRR